MGSRYLQEAPFEEAMRKWGEPTPPEPLTCTVWTHDFMAMARHNIPCPVCFDRSASMERNVTPGQWSQQVQPCADCQKKGWRVRRSRWPWRSP